MTTRAPITWFGGKSRLLGWLLPHFPRHTIFVDVFGGSGAVLLGKTPSLVEVYNDIDERLVTMFRVLRDPVKAQKLIDALVLTPYSRAEFEVCTSLNAGCEVERTRRFIVRMRQSHGGGGMNWSYSKGDSAAGMSSSVRRFLSGVERLPEIVERLRHVQIEKLDWFDLLTRYDTPETLFYMDPTYLNETRVSGGYQHELTKSDHSQLVEAITTLQGSVVLSGYEHPIYRRLVESHGWRTEEKTTPAMTSRHRANRTEKIWIKSAINGGAIE